IAYSPVHGAPSSLWSRELARRAITLKFMRPEDQLLLYCARTCAGAGNAAHIRALVQADINWSYLLQTTQTHPVAPLLYWNLKNTCPDAVPQSILDQLLADFHANTHDNLFLTAELLKLLALLAAHDIPAIPFKGPVLAAQVYRNLALRQFYDLDIL